MEKKKFEGWSSISNGCVNALVGFFLKMLGNDKMESVEALFSSSTRSNAKSLITIGNILFFIAVVEIIYGIVTMRLSAIKAVTPVVSKQPSKKICKSCGTTYDGEFSICPVCGTTSVLSTASDIPQQSKNKECKDCGITVDGKLNVCPICGKPI